MGNTIIFLGKSGERRGAMLEFEDVDPQKFAQLVADAPQWTEWMDGVIFRHRLRSLKGQFLPIHLDMPA
ncbi:hypothetical protein FD724_35835 (plasmid) [Nostoc sp. C057]|uniref:hypothetical protein n=1 Tax=Nostoc sp. C057 TaxID=2576903 RepID=UPI0015C31051|nr:hypothetical protein [Nostoc sp. C057]QLE53287.1 hypothetical protein FD724_35835 [Nostoc sp. C057]